MGGQAESFSQIAGISKSTAHRKMGRAFSQLPWTIHEIMRLTNEKSKTRGVEGKDRRRGGKKVRGKQKDWSLYFSGTGGVPSSISEEKGDKRTKGKGRV